MTEFANYCPVAMGTEVFGDRWTPLIIRELLLGSTRFNDIARGLPGISRSLLVQRLKQLERKGVVDIWPVAVGRGNEYRLTPAGEALESVVMTLGEWAVTWLFDDYEPVDVEPETLTWWMRRRLDVADMPPGRTVVQFDHTEPRRQSVWVVIDRGAVSVCREHPGFDPDVLVTAATPTLANVFMGVDSWRRATARGAIRIDGPPALARAVPRWFRPSPFAEAVHKRRNASAPTRAPGIDRSRLTEASA